MTAMLDHCWIIFMSPPNWLYHKLHNLFRVVFIRKTPIFVPNSHTRRFCIVFWFRVEREVQRRIINRAFDCSCVPKVCVACLKRTERMCWTYGSTNFVGIRWAAGSHDVNTCVGADEVFLHVLTYVEDNWVYVSCFHLGFSCSYFTHT